MPKAKGKKGTREIPKIFLGVKCRNPNDINWTVVVRICAPPRKFKGLSLQGNLYLCQPNRLTWLEFLQINGFAVTNEEWEVDALRHREHKSTRALDTMVYELLRLYKYQLIDKAHVITLVEIKPPPVAAVPHERIERALPQRHNEVPRRSPRNRLSRAEHENQNQQGNCLSFPNPVPPQPPLFQNEDIVVQPVANGQLPCILEEEEEEVITLRIIEIDDTLPQEIPNQMYYQEDGQPVALFYPMPPPPPPPQINYEGRQETSILRTMLEKPLPTNRSVEESRVTRYQPRPLPSPMPTQREIMFSQTAYQFQPLPPTFGSNPICPSMGSSEMSLVPFRPAYLGEAQTSTSSRANENLVFADLVPLQKKKMPPLVSIEALKRFLEEEEKANNYLQDVGNNSTRQNLYIESPSSAAGGEDQSNIRPEGVVGNLRRRVNSPGMIRISPPLAQRDPNSPSFPPRRRDEARRIQNRGGDGRIRSPRQEVGERENFGELRVIEEEEQDAGGIFPSTPSPYDLSMFGRNCNR